tara:strand:+ start:279 stop:824 length:546 start_codon:yes stop_codon:yes gene_type:complete
MIIPQQIHDFVNVALPIVVPAHGIIDVIDAHDKNLTNVYVESNIKAFATYPIASTIFPGFSFLYFMTFSAIHWRHQMTMFEDDNLELKLLASSFVVSLQVLDPDIVLLFLILCHTPSQYQEHFELLKKHKIMSLLYIGSTTAISCCLSFENWFDNPVMMSFIISHVFYQEFDRYKSNDITF